jgi:hypothetical protein
LAAAGATNGTAFIVRVMAEDGEMTWVEGQLLAGVDLLFALCYYFESYLSKSSPMLSVSLMVP